MYNVCSPFASTTKIAFELKQTPLGRSVTWAEKAWAEWARPQEQDRGLRLAVGE